MTLSIRDPEADALARRLAKMDNSTVASAVVVALREAIATRVKRESPMETARRVLTERGLSFAKNRKPVPPEAYHEFDHDLTGEGDVR